MFDVYEAVNQKAAEWNVFNTKKIAGAVGGDDSPISSPVGSPKGSKTKRRGGSKSKKVPKPAGRILAAINLESV